MIRCALAKDAETIQRVSKEVTILRHAPDSVSGLAEYEIPDILNLCKRIARSPFFYVYEREDDVIGFLAAYRSSVLRSSIFSGDEIIGYIRRKPDSFVYFDQVAIAPPFQNRGLAIRLIEQMHLDVLDYGYNIIRGPISHAPHRNSASIKLVEHLGYLFEEEFHTSNGLTFGVYRKDFLS